VGPLAIDGALGSAGRAYSIRNATLALGAFRAVGDLVADLRNDVPKLQASLSADTLWLDGLVPASGAAGGDWGRAKLPFAVLRNIDADLRIQARSLAYANVTAGAADASASLKDGKLEAEVTAQLDATGTLSVTVGVDTGSAPPNVSLSVRAVNSAVQPLFGALTGVRGLTGKGDFGADLTASGTTQEELAGTLKGTASIGIANGRIAGVDLASLYQAVKQKILEGWPLSPEGTPFDNLNGDATIADGIVTFRDLSLEAPTLSIRLEGIVDLLRQGIDVSASATDNGQPLLAVPVIARGLWGSPKIFPDVPNILANPEGGFAHLQDLSPLQGN
jgi:AsmA protein